ncbi:polysaccharide biosynthesis protein [uncultured Friedmanniella sp.]|uniref:polysaccharide biosynthesis protein n=1 Tax=uncultured Friedmanniella sp. TaxID=335381 RepID=UPI0035CA0C75
MLEADWRRRVARLLWDCASWAMAALLVVYARYEFALQPSQYLSIAVYVVFACVLQAVVGTAMMLYRGRYRTASFDEIFGLAVTAGLVSAALFFGTMLGLGSGPFPRATPVLVPPIALLLMVGARGGYRAFVDRRARTAQQSERVLIYGAGRAGYQLMRLINSDPTAGYEVVGFVDDARTKRNLRLMGVPVLGTGDRLLDIAADRDATTVILAIPQADAETVRRLSSDVEGAGLHFMVLPPLSEMLGRPISLADVREVDIADILGRHQVETDLARIAGYLTGKRVLVTGAGGSIGAELARQVHRFGPSELILLDRDESGLHGVQLSIYGQGLLDTPDMVLADIRDEDTVTQVFARHRPEVVFHAAALKHLPMLEQYPDEGWKTNVLGTRNVLRAARACGCERFVNVSTDKAADPTSVLGRTKRTAEQLTAWYAQGTRGTYLSVRFGNVLGSRGSMLHTFNAQIRAGGPVTVTHPEITRYFMTIPEACALVIQAGAVGGPGEVLVLDMGEPVSILEVAKRMIAQSGQRIEIVFTGLRHGEKMHEVLLSQTESGRRRSHPLITHVAVPPLSPADLKDDRAAATPLWFPANQALSAAP